MAISNPAKDVGGGSSSELPHSLQLHGSPMLLPPADDARPPADWKLTATGEGRSEEVPRTMVSNQGLWGTFITMLGVFGAVELSNSAPCRDGGFTWVETWRCHSLSGSVRGLSFPVGVVWCFFLGTYLKPYRLPLLGWRAQDTGEEPQYPLGAIGV